MTDFHGLPTGVLENDHIRLEYLAQAGPRVVTLSCHGSPNLFADVFGLVWDSPHGAYRPYGGHRFWISPESPEKTYIPDSSGLQVTHFPNGVELTGQREAGSGVCKRIRIELLEGMPAVRLVHTVSNENSFPTKIAAWAITMFRQGGTVLLPQPVGNVDAHGLLPNRHLVLWPYTRIAERRLTLRDDFILLHAVPDLPPAKLGYAGNQGWLAYWLDGILFRKSFDLHPGGEYPDGGCNTEAYCNDRAVELETLGPLENLDPGASTSLTETWELYETLDVPFIPEEIRTLIG